MDEMVFKILLIGDSDSGKTSLMLRFTDNIFEEYSAPTIGVEFKNKKIKINEQYIKLQILDTAGQEKYHSVARNFIRNADGFIFVFDLTNERSFECIRGWLFTCEEINQDYPKILVGNNIDRPYRKVNYERAENFGIKYNMKYFETSPKDGTNVELIFEEIARLILSRKLERQKNEKNTKKERLLNSPKKKKTDYNKNKKPLNSPKIIKTDYNKNKNNYKLELDKLLKFMSK